LNGFGGHLTGPEWQELILLMQEARYRHLAAPQERRLRELVAKRDGNTQDLAWDDLVKLGLVILGGYFIVKALGK
jgi:hypothetical protein